MPRGGIWRDSTPRSGRLVAQPPQIADEEFRFPGRAAEGITRLFRRKLACKSRPAGPYRFGMGGAALFRRPMVGQDIQRLATRVLLAGIAQGGAGDAWIPSTFVDACARVLADGLAGDAALAAEALTLPSETVLADTVARYNRYVDGGRDPDFGREHLVHKHGKMRRIERGPFYAYPSTVAVFGTYCGLCVDGEMRVKDVFGKTVDGLLAAGEVVGGLHGAAYMTGSALGKAAIFGRIAARTAHNR